MKTLETVLNHELKLASDWLKANRLSLNRYKSKLIIFKSEQKRFDNDTFSINWLEPFKRITIQLILLNPSKIRAKSKIQKILNGKK